MDGRRYLLVAVPVTAITLALALGACTRPDRVGDDALAGQATELRWRPADDVVICDGTERRAGTVEQAEAREAIEFTSALPIEVAAGRADDDGVHPLTWTCQPEEASLRWDLTATGVDSGRSVDLTIVGAAVSVRTLGELTVALSDDAIACDGARHSVGVVAGLEAGERVVFESEQGGQARPQRADDAGNLVFTWSCRPGDLGQTWPATATAEESERSVSFQLQGLAPADDLPLEVRAALAEVPCDGQIHALATLVNLVPNEPVTFTAVPEADDLRDGTAAGDGTIDLRWQCERDDAGRTWDLTALATETGKTISLRFAGVAGQTPGSATVRLLEDAFVCDGERRPVAVLEGLVIGEFVDFTSPQADALLEGRFDQETLTVNWQCDATDLGGADPKVWEVTATGRQSGRSATFSIVGVRPPP